MNKTLIAGAKIFDASGAAAVRRGRARRGQSDSCGVPDVRANRPGRLPGHRRQGHVPDARHDRRPCAPVVRNGHLHRGSDHAAARGAHAAHRARRQGAARSWLHERLGRIRGEAAAGRRRAQRSRRRPPARPAHSRRLARDHRHRRHGRREQAAQSAARALRSSSTVRKRCARPCACAAARAATTSSSMSRATRSIRTRRRTRRRCRSRKSSMAVETAHAYGRKVNAHTRSIGGTQALPACGRRRAVSTASTRTSRRSTCSRRRRTASSSRRRSACSTRSSTTKRRPTA